MIGQHPQVGISSLLIDQSLLQSLAMEMDVSRHLDLPQDVWLATLMASLGADATIKSPIHAMHLNRYRNQMISVC